MNWNDIIKSVTCSPFFGISFSVAVFAVGSWIHHKARTPVANPLLLAAALGIIILSAFRIPFEDYYKGGEIIHYMLVPATAILALSVYNQLELLKKNIIPMLAGCIAGAGTALVSVWAMCRLFGLDGEMTVTLLPKSVTTAIAQSVSEQHGGIPSITVAAVVVTGIFGAVASPMLIKLFRVKNPLAAGVAIGASSHAAGTSKAIEIGELHGASSSVAIGIVGLATSIMMLFIRI